MKKFYLVGMLALGLAGVSHGADNEPPAGFVAIFNGKDLKGWHGYDTKDPRKFQAMSAEEQAAAAPENILSIRIFQFRQK